MEETTQKVFFVQKIGEGEFETEGIWCTKSGDHFVVDNIPFVAKRISVGDKIKATFSDEDKVYYFEAFIEVSGNSTIRIYFNDESIIQGVRKMLEGFNCELEAFLSRKLIAVNVPNDIDYKPVKEFLEQGEQNDFWTYEESCLAHQY